MSGTGYNLGDKAWECYEGSKGRGIQDNDAKDGACDQYACEIYECVDIQWEVKCLGASGVRTLEIRRNGLSQK